MREDYLPWTKFGANLMRSQIGTEAARRQSVIEEIKRDRNAHQTGEPVLEISGEEYTLDESRAWHITTMNTSPGPNGAKPVTRVTNAEILAARPIACRSASV